MKGVTTYWININIVYIWTTCLTLSEANLTKKKIKYISFT